MAARGAQAPAEEARATLASLWEQLGVPEEKRRGGGAAGSGGAIRRDWKTPLRSGRTRQAEKRTEKRTEERTQKGI